LNVPRNEHGGNTHACGCPIGNCDCPATTATAAVCEACGTPPRGNDLLSTIQLAPGFTAKVCAARSGYNDDGPAPSPPCERKIRALRKLCPGCGKAGITPGELCKGCRAALARQKTAGDRAVKWYAIDGGHLFGEYLSTAARQDEGAAGTLAREIAELLAKACAGSRRWKKGLSDETWGQAVIPPKGSDAAHTGMVSVELDEAQAHALYALAERFQEIGKKLIAFGFAEGDSLLHRLARGETKPDDYEQWSSKRKQG
jgi:hypothetical protein